MPKDTFTHIPAAKRERVLSEAARLFAERGFSQTDMAELAARAGVSKGSLYTYFESKEELYIHVCRHGLERSRAAVYGGLDPEWDIYRQLSHIFRAGVAFSQTEPQYVNLYLNVASAGMAAFADQLSLEVEKFTADHLKHLLRRDMAAGLVRGDVDVSLAAFLINSLYIMFIGSLVSHHFGIRMKEYLEIPGELNQVAIDDYLERTIDLIAGFLRPL